MGAQKSSQVKSGHSKLGLSQDLDLELASIGKPHILWRFNLGFLHISTIPGMIFHIFFNFVEMGGFHHQYVFVAPLPQVHLKSQ